MHIDAKSDRCCKYSPADLKSYFPPGSTFQPNRETVSTGFVFVNIIWTQFEPNLPVMIENNKSQQITRPKGQIGFSSLDKIDSEEPNYQIRNSYELTNAVITTWDNFDDRFLLHSTIPAHSPGQCQQIIHGTEESILKQPYSFRICISADAKLSHRLAELLLRQFSGLQATCRRTKL